MIINSNTTYIYNTIKGVLFREHHITKIEQDSVLYTIRHRLNERDYNMIEAYVKTNMLPEERDYEHMTNVRARILTPLFSLGM